MIPFFLLHPFISSNFIFMSSIDAVVVVVELWRLWRHHSLGSVHPVSSMILAGELASSTISIRWAPFVAVLQQSANDWWASAQHRWLPWVASLAITGSRFWVDECIVIGQTLEMARPQLGESGPTSRLNLLHIPLYRHICKELLCQTVTRRGILDLASDDCLGCSEGDGLVGFIWQAGGSLGVLVCKFVARDIYLCVQVRRAGLA